MKKTCICYTCIILFYLYKWPFVFLLRIAVTGYMYVHVTYRCTVVAFKTYFIIIVLLCSILNYATKRNDERLIQIYHSQRLRFSNTHF